MDIFEGCVNIQCKYFSLEGCMSEEGEVRKCPNFTFGNVPKADRVVNKLQDILQNKAKN